MKNKLNKYVEWEQYYNPAFNWNDENVLEPLSESTIAKYKQIDSTLSNAIFTISYRKRDSIPCSQFHQIFLLLLVVISFVLGKFLLNAADTLKIFSSAYCLAYGVNGVMTYHFAKNSTSP